MTTEERFKNTSVFKEAKQNRSFYITDKGYVMMYCILHYGDKVFKLIGEDFRQYYYNKKGQPVNTIQPCPYGNIVQKLTTERPEIRKGTLITNASTIIDGTAKGIKEEEKYWKLARQEAREILIRNAAADESILLIPKEMFDGLRKDTLSDIAGNSSCPAELLKYLAKQRESYIRSEVANNPSCPLETMDILKEDRSEAVRTRLAENINCPADILETLADTQSENILISISANPNCPTRILETIANTELESNRDLLTFMTIADNPNCPDELRKRMNREEQLERGREELSGTVAVLLNNAGMRLRLEESKENMDEFLCRTTFNEAFEWLDREHGIKISIERKNPNRELDDDGTFHYHINGQPVATSKSWYQGTVETIKKALKII